jgi:hypothetical protein
MTEVLIVSIIIAIASAIGVSVGVLVKYKKGLFGHIYPLEHYTNLNLTHREDRFLNRQVTRVKVSSDSNKKK